MNLVVSGRNFDVHEPIREFVEQKVGKLEKHLSNLSDVRAELTVNKAKAMQVLRSRLLKLEQDRQTSELSEARRDQVGGGGRSEKVRTYNFKENRVSDHRIGLTIYKLDKVLGGELDEVSDALVHDEQTRRLTEAT